MSSVFMRGQGSSHPVTSDWHLVDDQIRGLEGGKPRLKESGLAVVLDVYSRRVWVRFGCRRAGCGTKSLKTLSKSAGPETGLLRWCLFLFVCGNYLIYIGVWLMTKRTINRT